VALATAYRHPGVALTIATANFPHEELVAPALMLYQLISAFFQHLACGSAATWRKGCLLQPDAGVISLASGKYPPHRVHLLRPASSDRVNETAPTKSNRPVGFFGIN